jgi:hypothetical protein
MARLMHICALKLLLRAKCLTLKQKEAIADCKLDVHFERSPQRKVIPYRLGTEQRRWTLFLSG